MQEEAVGTSGGWSSAFKDDQAAVRSLCCCCCLSVDPVPANQNRIMSLGMHLLSGLADDFIRGHLRLHCSGDHEDSPCIAFS